MYPTVALLADVPDGADADDAHGHPLAVRIAVARLPSKISQYYLLRVRFSENTLVLEVFKEYYRTEGNLGISL